MLGRSWRRCSRVLTFTKWPRANAAAYSTTPSDRIVTCPFPEVEIPEKTFFHFVTDEFEKYGSNTAIIDSKANRHISFDELAESIGRVASGYLRMGVQKNDVFSIVSNNHPHYVVQLFSTVGIGAVAHPINQTFTAGEISYQFKDCGTKYVATSAEALPKVKEAASEAGIPHDRIVVLASESDGGSGEHVSMHQLLRDSGSAFSPSTGPLMEPESTCCLLYSSGTTGLPKGVLLTNRNLVANLCQMKHPQLLPFSPGDCGLGVLPFFHIYGTTIILSNCLHQGAAVLSVPKFDPDTFLSCLERFSVTTAFVAPPLALFLAKYPSVDQYNLSSIKQVFSAAAPLSLEVADAIRQRAGVQVVRQGYGLTETSPLTHVMPVDVDKPNSIGGPVLNTEVRVVDQETGNSLGPDQMGELLMRGPQVMKGYLNRPQATAAAISEDGWFHSGDIGYYDKDGHFYIVDRLKELIKVKGFQVAPAELEGLLLTHPQVADCAVVGVADERAGEVPRAFVVAKSKDLSEKDVQNFVASKLSKHKHLKGGVVFVDSVPKSPSGKILRRLLRE